MIRFFRKDKNNILKNLQEYEQKEKAKQQKPEVLGQKQVKQKENREKSARMHNS
tara:strand:+ start:457 stop:618 length:162 start_codon:yes stop_codon:yes gene_type:complete